MHSYMKGQKDQANTEKHNKKNYILPVDDYTDIVRLIEQALSKHGLRVSVFTDPFMALEHIRTNQNHCSFVLSDIRMPGMNG